MRMYKTFTLTLSVVTTNFDLARYLAKTSVFAQTHLIDWRVGHITNK
jgi:hypothetical protein